MKLLQGVVFSGMLSLLAFGLPFQDSHLVGSKQEAAARQQLSPLTAALTGMFSPPFVVVLGMASLAHTVDRFVKDVVRDVANNGVRRIGLRRRRKKKPTEANQSNKKPQAQRS